MESACDKDRSELPACKPRLGWVLGCQVAASCAPASLPAHPAPCPPGPACLPGTTLPSPPAGARRVRVKVALNVSANDVCTVLSRDAELPWLEQALSRASMAPITMAE